MGQQRNTVIETAVDLEKLKKVEKEAEKEAVAKGGKPKKQGKAKSRSRRYKTLIDQVDKSKEYSPKEAISIIKKTSSTKFSGSVEVHVNLNFSKDKSDQQIRTTIALPHNVSTGKEKKQKILVFTTKNNSELKKLGADIGTEATLKELEKGKIAHDKIISDSSWMAKLATVAKVLGPRGLMPSPKSGTVSDDPVSVLKEFAKGKLEVRTESYPIIHTKLGGTILEENKLLENFEALIKTIRENKPENFKKELFKSIYLSSTMGPSVKIDLSSIS